MRRVNATLNLCSSAAAGCGCDNGRRPSCNGMPAHRLHPARTRRTPGNVFDYTNGGTGGEPLHADAADGERA